jgi:hypothetical protein
MKLQDIAELLILVIFQCMPMEWIKQSKNLKFLDKVHIKLLDMKIRIIKLFSKDSNI